jgi:hypothetical protein
MDSISIGGTTIPIALMSLPAGRIASPPGFFCYISKNLNDNAAVLRDKTDFLLQ